MAKTVYDIAKLEELCKIDAERAVKGYENPQAYFDELDLFAGMPKKYFHEYNPTVVVYDDDTRAAFLKEVDELKTKYASLGFGVLVAALEDLEDAVDKKSVGSLSDWIVSLGAKAEQLSAGLASAKADTNAANAKTAKPLVLAVDDKPQLLTAIVDMLKDKCTVMGATSGAAALKAIGRHTPRLFLLDIEMPQMNGYELAKIIRGHSKFQDTPIIFLTAKNTREAVVEALTHGADDFIVKPVKKDLLISKIEQYNI